ncbi:hypothetical protein Ddye_023502 [Dipteronia dyeriana]|uniref:Uncharacterized protein n=1 Tax=Dipteronia dyeriana TaxID=168575 RepID=A0AAD9TT44_9ROSI|nr:hypothetical protein Ddye_023502 [Dipteronia dyeriana]
MKVMVVALELATEEVPRWQRWWEIGIDDGGLTTGTQTTVNGGELQSRCRSV